MQKKSPPANGIEIQKSESVLNPDSSDSGLPLNATEALKRICELEKRLSDLEDQNRKLKSANETNEKLFRTVIDNVSSGVALIDETGKFSLYNPLFLKLFGLAEDSSIKNVNDQDWSQWQVFNEDGNLLHVDDHPVRKAALSGKRVDNQLVGVKLPGGDKLTWMLISAEPIVKDNGKIDRIICTYRDITEIRKAEEELRLSEQKYRTIVETSMEGIAIGSPEGKFLFVNKRLAEMLGYTVDEILGKSGSDFMYDEQVKPIQSARNHLHGGEIVRGEFRWRRKDGSLMWTVYHANPMFDSQGNHTGNLVLHTDITDRKSAEEALWESEEKFSKAFYSNPAAMILSDYEGRYIEANDSFCSLTGYRRDEIIGHTSVELNLIDDEKRISILDQVIGKGFLHDNEVEIQTKSGEKRTVINNAEKIELSSNTFIISFLYDITNRKKAEKELFLSMEQSTKQAKELEKVLDSVPAAVWIAHDPKALNITGNKLSYDWLHIPMGANASKSAPEGERPETFRMFKEGKELEPEEMPVQLSASGIEIRDYEFTFLYTDGSERHVLGNAVPIHDEQGEPGGSVSSFMDITERKKAEEELRKNEADLTGILNATTESIWMFSADGRILLGNKIATDRIGLPREMIIGNYFKDVIPKELAETRMEQLLDTIRTKRHRIFEDWRADVCYEHSFYPVVDASGEINRVVAFSRDITEHKKADESLRQSEERFRQLANAITQLAWIAHADGYIFWYNDRWYHYTGTTPEQMEGWGWQSVHDPAMLPDVMNRWKLSLEKGEAFEMVFPLKGKDGIFREFLTRGIPIKNNEGKILQWFGTNTDVSELKKAEHELKRAQEKLNIALENGNIGIWEWDVNTDELLWDIRMEKMFGLEPGTFERTYKAFESLVHEEDLPHIRKAINDALENDIPLETVYRTSLRNGDTKYISAKAMLNKDKDGKPVNMAGVCFDITEMKKGAEQVLIKLNEELLRSNKDLERFAYVASHDLQEPLRMVSSFTQLLAKRYKDALDEQAQEYIGYAVEGVNRMYDLINGLLALSRIQTKAKEFTEVKLLSVMHKVMQNLNAKIRERNVVITMDELPELEADEGQMVQLMQNLVANAIKFSTEQPKIHISSKTEGNQVTFSVKDNGIGIEPEYFERIFQIFQRLVTRDHYEGTGIGLAICKRIVERHGGNIWLESEPGNGTTFYITIPRKMSA